VIVDPRFRGSGIATRLVKAYLKRPMTTCTEALAAMGRASSFFDAAGMTRYEMPPSARHARLMDLFEQFGIEAWDLADAAAATARAKRRIGARLLGRELRVWAGAMDRGNRRYRSVDDLMRLAAKRVASTPVAFAAGGRGMRG
jgi:GNAT superfamily N-acetyltransferase